MARNTIDFGIDLGTTNSEVAVLKGTRPEIIKNNDNQEFTPSAVWIDAKNRLYVGQRAKDRIESDPQNAYCEFKRKMGTKEVEVFRDSGREMSPIELSAEVLKSIKASVYQRLHEEITAAVITVPADFDLPQTAATEQAARLAGLDPCPLLQEPIAAALAYGFQNTSDKVFWLVYDFGGGTFDAALIQLRDGDFRVVNHGGDKYLGGKDIDWAIVNKLLVPAITKQNKIENFERSNPFCRGAFAKLKAAAEAAKIQLSSEEFVQISVEFDIEIQGEREHFDFEYELSREDVIPLAAPFIQRTIECCKQVIEEVGIQPRDIDKVLLVGGPTLAPYLREMLEHPVTGLQIPLEYSIDPFTVVAQGAAVFAGSQRLSHQLSTTALPNQAVVKLEYQPVGSDPEPIVGGKVLITDQPNLAGYTIEFTGPHAWSSGKTSLQANGSFMVVLFAEPGNRNIYKILIQAPDGNPVSVQPDELSYTIGNISSTQPLTHSISVALANNELIVFLEQGASLPARRLERLRTTVDLHKGTSGEFISIPVVEGKNPRANRNRPIGWLKIHGDTIRRDVQTGSEIEIAVNMNQSRSISVKAYIPVLDEEFEQVMELESAVVAPSTLLADLEQEVQRLQRLEENAQHNEDTTYKKKISNICQSELIESLQEMIAAAPSDIESGKQAQDRLLKLKIMIDEIEDALEWPTLVAEAEEEIRLLTLVAEEIGNDKARQAQATLEQEARHAIKSHQVETVRRKAEEMCNLRFAILRGDPGFWVNALDNMEEWKSDMRDKQQAERWLVEGRRAIQNNDLDKLKVAVRQLASLLPDNKREAHDFGFGSTIIQ